MVFPSVPIYFDTPNWPQQHGRDGGGSYQSSGHHQLPHPPPSVMGAEGGMGGASSIKSGLMTDRARIAKIPQPEMALKCPRCESTNTKFCYFNNYSLAQPRHLCKTCRRYWTRGGALRNVPVGGGCRRNKRSGSKGGRSKSPDNYRSVPASTSCTSSDVMMSHFPPQHFLSQLNQYGGSTDVNRLSFGAPATGSDNEAEFQMNVGGFVEQWRLQQHQFAGLYTFGQSEAGAGMEPCQTGQIRSKAMDTEMAPVKVEDTHCLGISGGGGDHNQYWLGGGANAWTELAGLTDSSSSTRHLL